MLTQTPPIPHVCTLQALIDDAAEESDDAVSVEGERERGLTKKHGACGGTVLNGAAGAALLAPLCPCSECVRA